MQSSELSRIMGDLNVEGGNDDEDDLLDLMDSAQWQQWQMIVAHATHRQCIRQILYDIIHYSNIVTQLSLYIYIYTSY